MQLFRYVERQWINKSTRLSVWDNPSRTRNLLDSFQSVPPKLVAFLGHLQRTTVDSQADVSRLSRGMTTRRAKKASTLSTAHESTPVYVGSTTTSTPDSNF